MRLTQLTLCNFRCFGLAPSTHPTTVDLANFTAFIGSNGAGKTAILQALVRLFGERPADRRLMKADFHVPPHTEHDQTLTSRQLWLEARIEFPDLASVGHASGVPECFRQMLVPGVGQPPFCRIRLEATWTQTAQAEGEVDERLWWVTQADVQSEGAEPLPEEVKTPLLNSERSIIQVLYVPAIRDPAAQLRLAAGALLQPLLKAIPWSDATKLQASTAAKEVQDAIHAEPGMKLLEETIEREWRQLQDFVPLQQVMLQPINADFDSLLRYMGAVFRSCEGAHLQPVECLSDGLRSLFYFALLGARFELERQIIAQIGQPVNEGNPLTLEAVALPLLTLFAIEEPENHLAPHYLSHIISLLRRQKANDRIQVLLTSQSPAILGRVDPEEIRHVQHDYQACTVSVRALKLPARQDEAYTYVKEAVRAFPELYFAKAVVLGEGDSEAVALPRIARQLGLPLEEQLISFVPLGGRHVNHFWNLLNDLYIPHVTLLDLDRERHGGGWGRIHYAIVQLIKNRVDITLDSFNLTQAQLDEMPNYALADTTILAGWLTCLEEHGVYYSAPLDLDFLLMQAFPTAYQQPTTGGTGPRDTEDTERIEKATRAVLKLKGGDGSTYTETERQAFVWYHYLFLGRGKPVTHMMALSHLEANAPFHQDVPPVLKRLLTRVTQKEVAVA